MLQTKSARSNTDCIVATESIGRGPTVIICHSNSTSARLYRSMLEGPIGQRYRVLALDLPGHGRSPRSADGARDYTIPGLAAAVIEAVAELAPGPCVVVGHSLGGHVLTTALERLPNASAVLLISAPPLLPTALGDIFRPDPTSGALFRPDLSESDVEVFAQSLIAPGLVPEAFSAEIRDAIRSTDPQLRSHLGASVGAGMMANEAVILARTTVPTALVYGTEDRFVNVSYYDRVELSSAWRGGRFAFPGSGHSPHWDATDRFAELLRAFVDDCLA